MLFADPNKFERVSSEMLDLSTPLEVKMNATYKLAMERNVGKDRLWPHIVVTTCSTTARRCQTTKCIPA